MKKIFFIACAVLVTTGALAQNVQLHYDFGRHIYDQEGEKGEDRQVTTITYETFKADNWGSWFYFVDFDMYAKGMKGAYTEISRELNFWKESNLGWLSAHVEYNGGLYVGRGNSYGSQFQHAMLVGPAYNGHNADFSKTWGVQLMYKYYFAGMGANTGGYHGWQLTGIWSTTFCQQALTFAGFADLWYDRRVDGNMIFLAEPQLWFNLKPFCDVPLSIGTEVELSNNFVASQDLQVWGPYKHKTFYINPTLALKWEF